MFYEKIYNSDIMILEIKAFTLESSRETVSCPATLFLLVSLLGIWDVDRLAGRYVCQNESAYIIVLAKKQPKQSLRPHLREI